MKQKKRWTIRDKIERDIKLRNENAGYSLTDIELDETQRKKRIEELRQRFKSLQ